jgi:acyl-coenzyme A synthetase/AMP-(fatty) acid ligase
MTIPPRLEDYLGLISPDRPALATATCTLTFGDILARAQSLRQARLPERLALNSDDLCETVPVLVAADGVADRLLLASPGLEPFALADLCAQADCPVMPSVDVSSFALLPDVAAPTAGSGRASDAGARETTWVLTTSGTTGAPKLVPHLLAGLIRSVRLDRIAEEGTVWGLLYDYTRFAGLQVVLQSLLSGACLAVPERTAGLGDRIRFLAAAGVTHLSATPTLWRKILMTAEHRLLQLKQVTLGGEIADAAILAALARAFPGARVSHIFASTEAGVGFSVTDGRAGFPVSYLDTPPSGIGLAVRDGRLFIRNSLAASTYLDGAPLSEEGWVDTGDMVEFEGGRVQFRGRASGVINVGGDKVAPAVVEAAVLAHPAVRLARIHARPNPITGALVAADIVPDPATPDLPALKADLTRFLAARLPRHMVPALIRFVEDLDVNPAGKIRRS